MRVPMRSTGTDYPVVATRNGNVFLAKGMGYPADLRGQP